jgi:hypothetical protein
VDVGDADNDVADLTFLWSADAGEMLHADEQSAEYYASFAGGTELKTWITVKVTDPDGASDQVRFEMGILAGTGN